MGTVKEWVVDVDKAFENKLGQNWCRRPIIAGEEMHFREVKCYGKIYQMEAYAPRLKYDTKTIKKTNGLRSK